MLPLALVEEIRRLLDEGQLSHRKIAAKLDISRGTVGAIASGRRGIYGREPAADDLSLACQDLAPQRCRSCGAMVYKPCVLCNARAYRKRQARLAELAVRRVGIRRRVA